MYNMKRRAASGSDEGEERGEGMGREQKKKRRGSCVSVCLCLPLSLCQSDCACGRNKENKKGSRSVCVCKEVQPERREIKKLRNGAYGREEEMPIFVLFWGFGGAMREHFVSLGGGKSELIERGVRGVRGGLGA
jgi:hypothetical protein